MRGSPVLAARVVLRHGCGVILPIQICIDGIDSFQFSVHGHVCSKRLVRSSATVVTTAGEWEPNDEGGVHNDGGTCRRRQCHGTVTGRVTEGRLPAAG